MHLRRNRSLFSATKAFRPAALAPVFVAAATAVATLLTPSEAKAGFAIGADLALPIPVDHPLSSGTGMTIEGRLGWQFGLAFLDVTPELKGGYSRISTQAGGQGVTRGLAGVRVGIGSFLQPGMFVHFGYGGVSDASGAFAYDVGGYLDVKISLFAVGIHGVWNEVTLSDTAAFKTFDVGLHANIVF